MTKLIALLTALLITPSAFAHGYYGGYHGNYYHGGGSGYVAPLVGGMVIGGVVGYALAPKSVATLPPIVIYHDLPIGYHQELIKDASCNCFRNVILPDYRP